LAANISYYTPWGNLAIFYKEGHLSSGLVRLGRIDSGLDRIRHMSVTVMRIERSQPWSNISHFASSVWWAIRLCLFAAPRPLQPCARGSTHANLRLAISSQPWRVERQTLAQ